MNTPGWFAEFFRSIFAALDSVGYWLLQGVYDIFFAVSNAEILSGATMNELYGRLQLIFGVFMVFKLSLTILNIIINPDNYKDKQKGAGSIVVRVAVMLVMLTLIIPINIPNPDGNPLNEKINQNGILFGFLYQFQDSVITENVLGKLILGSNVGSNDDSNNMADMGGLMTLQVARAFMTPTLVNEDTEINNKDSFAEDNTACYTDLKNNLHYFDDAVNPSYLLDHINDTCENDDAGGEVFAMQYQILGGFIFSIIMSIIVLGFTVDVAVRAIKLAILRIIAPVPIITYVTPGAEKDGAFGNWVKTLTSTYLDLFIRLAVISFGAYIIVRLTDGETLNIVTTSTNWFTTGLATIFVIIGILVFMKQAPKFFKDMLGIKGDGHLFSGVGAALGGAALLGGLPGSVISSARKGYEEGQIDGDGRLASGWRGVRAGVGGLIGGAYAGGKAFMTNDKKIPGSVYSSMQRRNAIRGSGSTWFGRTRDRAQSMFLGSSPVDRMDAQIEGYNEASSLVKSIIAKADADSKWTNSDGETIKGLKKQYDLLRDANAAPELIQAARDKYENSRDQLLGDALSGKYTEGAFASQMQTDLANIRGLERSLGIKLFGVKGGVNERLNTKLLDDDGNVRYDDDGNVMYDVAGAVSMFKALQYNAADEARNMKNTSKYNSRKVDQKYSQK